MSGHGLRSEQECVNRQDLRGQASHECGISCGL